MSAEVIHRPLTPEFPTRRFVDDRPLAQVASEPPEPSRVRQRALDVILRGVYQPRLADFEISAVENHALAEGATTPRRFA